MISVIKAVFKDIWSFFMPPTSKKKIIRTVVLVGAIFLAVSFLGSSESDTEEQASLPPTVFVGTLADVQNGDSASFVGTVRAISEAEIQSEVSGRITSVNVQAGDFVSAGTVLATIENTAQQAALLQAEGAYEAALAAAAQSEVSLEDAQNAAISAYRTAYTSAYGVVLTSVDQFFSDPNSRLVPGLRISTDGNSTYLNNTRRDLTGIFEKWRQDANGLDASDNLVAYLNEAEQYTRTIIQMVDVFIAAVSSADPDDTLDGVSFSSFASDLTAARATLNGILTSLANAEENLNRARIGGTQNTDVSLANAQVKQALGALRSAQANYEKTIFRSPISGTVNSLQVNVGDFISAFTQIAEVANNDALQVSIFAGESDLAQFSLGKSVTINNTVLGTVTSIAPAVDAVTQKTEIKIAAESAELTNGSTVTIRIDTTKEPQNNGPMKVPLTAVRFTAEDGFIFTVENGELVEHPVIVGDILGSLVVLESGIEADTVFVLDARGLTAGQNVEAVRK